MSSDFFKMTAQPPMMSTPIKGKYSSIFQEIALLPYRLFGRCSRETSDARNMGSARKASTMPSGVNMSPSRHSLRLLSNGYYICDEDSFCWDDLGNVSFSPTQCTVSYKENMVRIFRKRRRTLAQRRLDLTNNGLLNVRNPTNYEDINDFEPLVVEEIYHSSSDHLDLCDLGNTNLCTPTLLESAKSNTEHVSSAHSQSSVNAQYRGNSTKMLQSENNVESSPNPGIPQNVNDGTSDPMSPLECIPYVGEKEKADQQPSHHSCAGYLYINNDADTCHFSPKMCSWRPTKKRIVKRHSSDSLATTLTPSIESFPIDLDDTRRSSGMGRTLIFIPLLLLCLLLWWVRIRSPDPDSPQT